MSTELFSVRSELHDPNQSAVLIPKELASFGEETAALLLLGEELERRFKALQRIEGNLRSHGCTPPRPDLTAPLRAALSQWRGEGFWER